jgi:hypothetical protein
MIFGLGLHVIVAIYFAIHALRHGQNLYWLFILFAFPMLGSVVYFFAIYLPELRQSRGAMVAKRAIRAAIDPGRALREARQAFDLTPTVDNRARLAAALLEAGNAQEAAEHYRACLAGPFANDPKFLTGYAQASLAADAPADARAALIQLFEKAGEARRQPLPALLYARALAASQDAGTREAFEIAITVATDAEAKCRYADWLSTQADAADQQRAKALYADILNDSRHWHSHAKAMNKEWLKRAEAAR